jgi:hypothetical protein
MPVFALGDLPSVLQTDFRSNRGSSCDADSDADTEAKAGDARSQHLHEAAG